MEQGRRFVDKVQDSLDAKNFVSLVLRGVKKKKGKQNELRGSIRQVQGRLIEMASSKTKPKAKAKSSSSSSLLLQLTIKYHGATDICKNYGLEEASQTIHNLLLGDPTELASEWGAQALNHPIQSAQLTTTTEVWELRLDGKASLRKQKAKPAGKNSNDAASTATIQSHDRVKKVPLSNDAEFFQRLGVTKADGQPKPRMKGKLRQCQKFVEVVGKIVDECQAKDPSQSVSVVDMGCGRAYLTFSLHAYLRAKYPSVHTKGIDVRPKLVEEISGIARSLGGDFDSLTFETGTIEEVVAAQRLQEEEEDKIAPDDNAKLSVLVALHACDTATDDALHSGISRGASVLVVAPCCHKQVRPQLNAHVSATRGSHPLASVLQHGVYRERISETVTDSLRALLLEYAGYKVNVFEFIGGEHTSKNVMITAIQNPQPHDAATLESIGREIRSLASLHGIRHQKLAQMMGVGLVDAADEETISIDHLTSKKGTSSRIRKHRMPPIPS